MTEQQTVLVTGGASGIGYAVVEALLAEGGRAIVVDANEASLARCREAFAGSQDRLRFERLDVSDEAAVTDCLAACDEAFGPLTGVVNSAGIGRDVPALETSAALFRQILEVNLIGSFLVSREAAKRMRPRGSGAIVNITSVSGIAGNEGRVAYGSSKGGVITMTKVMAVELAPLGIRVNAIAPGPIDTPLARQAHTPEARAAWLSVVPQRRYGAPEDVAQTALFLLDARKSGYLTGQTISVDGGFTAAGLMTGRAAGAPPA